MKKTDQLIDRITEYLWAGGFFNPELMDHWKVRNLLVDCREQFIKMNKKGVNKNVRVRRKRSIKKR